MAALVMCRQSRIWTAALPFLLTGSLLAETAAFSVRDFGAGGEGATKDTPAIQAAVDKAAVAGGTVLFPPGRYLSGTVHLRSNVTLWIEQGAVVMLSPNDGDFDPYEELPYHPTGPAKYKPAAVIPPDATPFQRRRRSAPPAYDDEETNYFHYALLAGDGVRNVTILGAGTIDGNRPRRYGPKPIAFKNSEWITIRGITLKDAPNYAISLGGTDHVEVEGISIINAYADGIDPDGCHFVRITNCYIDSHDDAICPKSSWALGKPRSVEHLVVANCLLRTAANCFKFGSESAGDLRDVSVTNCVMLPRDTERNPNSGISLESVDGANIDGVAISNLSMQNVSVPVFIRLSNRGRGLVPPVPGSIANVSIRNIVATGARLTSSITGISGAHVRAVSVDGLSVTCVGGAATGNREVPELPQKDPDSTMFGELPALALYSRYVDRLSVTGLKVAAERADGRPSLMLEDVAHLEMDGFESTSIPAKGPVVVFRDVSGALISGSRVVAGSGPFLRIEGARSENIVLRGNDVGQATQTVERVR